MKGTIVYVFKIIMILIVSCFLWMLTIGTLDNKGAEAENGIKVGIVGTPTPFKEGIWNANEQACIRLLAKSTDTYGYGCEGRTQAIWVSANDGGVPLTDGQEPERGGTLPYNYQ